jgi:hypothetical protein
MSEASFEKGLICDICYFRFKIKQHQRPYRAEITKTEKASGSQAGLAWLPSPFPQGKRLIAALFPRTPFSAIPPMLTHRTIIPSLSIQPPV